MSEDYEVIDIVRARLEQKSENGEMGTLVRRWLARTFDTVLAADLIAVPAVLLADRFTPHVMGELMGAAHEIRFYGLFMLFIALGFVLDAAIHRLFGNTLGKALLGLSVIGADGRELDFGAYLRRNMRLWIYGMAFALPLVSAVTALVQFGRVMRDGHASYDAGEHIRVVRRPVGFLRPAGFVGACLLILAFVRHMDVERGTHVLGVGERAAPVRMGKAFTWTNPVTGKSTVIDGYWRMARPQGHAGIWSYEFTAPRVIMTIAEVATRGMELRTFVERMRTSPTSKLDFKGAGTFATYDGVPEWIGRGYTKILKTRLAMEMTVVERGGRFYAVSEVRNPTFTDARGEVAKLKAALLTTTSAK